MRSACSGFVCRIVRGDTGQVDLCSCALRTKTVVPLVHTAKAVVDERRCGVLLDESRRDDIGWLVAQYDDLVAQPASDERDAALEQVQRWLCRVTGLSSLSAAVAAARRLTHHEISFITPVALPIPEARLQPQPQPQPEPQRAADGRRHRPRQQPDSEQTVTAPPLNDEVAAKLEKLLGELDGLPYGRDLTTAEQAQVTRLRREICELTGLSRVKTARTALRNFLTRRDGARRFVPTKPYAQGPSRTPPPITVVLGGSPGGGHRA